ncbi:class I SAM-dependent methyltransferase [Actinomadura roseirufa]|uniref:class I SAM-dependent methyltransferase n=1 Tax=Actinomadura roseirufa TaxID=2094049 RepID=UPI0010413070|nr:SAM-dependent methyltransferase [Actinomadura roseirufa]
MERDGIILFREFLRHPWRVGAVTPSGRRLTEVLAGTVPRGGVVVELGPGTGAVTAGIRLRDPRRHVAVEVNPRLARVVERRWPGVEVARADAADLGRELAARALGPADTIVSSLPWAVIPADRAHAIMTAVRDALTDGGCFTTYAYAHTRWTPPARRLVRSLAEGFAEVTVSPVVWANMPPAVVYVARGPHRAVAG